MKISVVIICSVLIVQTSASFFSELTSSVSIVRSSVGKLLGDAVVDLKDTFDCTVFAVRQVFSSDSTVPGYYQKCQGDKAEDTMPQTPSKPVLTNIIPIVEPTSLNIYRSSQPSNREQKNLKDKPDTNINKKNEKKIQSVESYMLGETRILAIMSSKLEHEFEDLSKHVNSDLTKIENNLKQLSIGTVMQGIDKLHEEEAIHRNNTESEIREVFDRLTRADSKSNNTHKIVLKEEIKAALTELEQNKNNTHLQHEFENWKEEEFKSLNDIKDLLKKEEKNLTIKPHQTSTTTSNPSKTEKSTETVTITKPVTSTEPGPKATIRTPLVLTTKKPAALTELEQNKNNTHLQHEFENWKEEEFKSLNDIKDLLKKEEKNYTIKPHQTSTTTSNPSKTEKSTETVTINKPVTSTEPGPKATIRTPLVLTTKKPAALTELAQNKNNTHLQHEFENWKEEEFKSLNDIKDLLKKEEKNLTIKPHQTSTTTSNPSKTEKSTETVTITKPVTSTEPGPKATIRTPLVLTTKKPANTTKNNLIKTNNLLRKDNKTLGQALKLFSKAKKSSSLMAKIFKRTTSVPG